MSIVAARTALVILGLGAWFWTQAAIAKRAFPEGRIGDRLHELTAPLHDALFARPRLANRLLVCTSGLIDLLGLFLIVQAIIGPSIRPLLGLLVLFSLRQACQALCALPLPPGMIWRNPGFPSLLVTYGTATDLFFSGHTAIAVYGSLELAHALGPVGAALGVLVTVVEVTTVIVLRAHYTMDVFTGAVTALWVWTVVSGIAPRINAALLGLAR
jgi:hypothetical protein